MIKIYVACLASYNNGFLFGQWFDLDDFSDKDQLLEAIHEKILNAPENPSRLKYGEEPEEWSVHDYDTDCTGLDKSEYPDLEELIEINHLLGETNGKAILGVKEYLGLDTIEEAREYFELNHIGEFSDLEALAYYVAEEVNGWNLDEGPGRYFDAEAYGRDLDIETFEVNGHYFLEQIK